MQLSIEHSLSMLEQYEWKYTYVGKANSHNEHR